MATIVITGANRGIGLALTRLYAAQGDRVIALCRTPDKAEALHALAKETGGRVEVGRIDIGDRAAIEAAAKAIDGPVDILINNAGVVSKSNLTIQDIDVDEWLDDFRIMAIGPFLVTRALLPNLTQARGKVAFLSSQLASSSWVYGGYYSYSSAKAAGNRIAQILALDLKDKGITTVSFHPGYVRTDMSGPGADIEPEESAEGIAREIGRLSAETSGAFVKWNGEVYVS